MDRRIFEMELHERILIRPKEFGFQTSIIRVPGGWIYQNYIEDSIKEDKYFNPVFVPYSENIKSK